MTATGKDLLKYGAAYAPNIETIVAVAFDQTATDVIVDGATTVKMDKVDNQTKALALAAIASLRLILPPSSTIAVSMQMWIVAAESGKHLLM
jgi:hypothetical protein